MAEDPINPELLHEQAQEQAIESVVRHCIAMRVQLMNRVVTGLYDSRLRPYGLRAAQMNILVAVSRMGQTNPGALARILCLEKSTLSRNVHRMRQQGWLEAVPAPDGRVHLLRITAKGRTLLAQALTGWRLAQERVSALLGTDGVEAVDRLTDALQPGRGSR